MTTSELDSFSAGLAAAVRVVSDSVVRVAGRRRLAASGLVWSADGLIVTANHALERESGLEVGLPDGQSTPARLLGRDPATDLALLQVEGLTLRPPQPSAAALEVGHLVLAVGRPGRTAQAAIGIVSALGSAWMSPMGGQIDAYLQTDVVMYPGFSGGALVDTSGHLLGMNTSDLLRAYSVAVPPATIDRVARTLATEGRVRSGFLGVVARPVRLPLGLAAELGQESGLLLQAVAAEGPAARAGLALGDILVAVDSQPVRSLDDLAWLLSDERVGQSVPVRVMRAGRLVDRTVCIGRRP